MGGSIEARNEASSRTALEFYGSEYGAPSRKDISLVSY